MHITRSEWSNQCVHGTQQVQAYFVASRPLNYQHKSCRGPGCRPNERLRKVLPIVYSSQLLLVALQLVVQVTVTVTVKNRLHLVECRYTLTYYSFADSAAKSWWLLIWRLSKFRDFKLCTNVNTLLYNNQLAACMPVYPISQAFLRGGKGGFALPKPCLAPLNFK